MTDEGIDLSGAVPLTDEEMEGLCECCGEVYGEAVKLEIPYGIEGVTKTGNYVRYFCGEDCKQQWMEGFL